MKFSNKDYCSKLVLLINLLSYTTSIINENTMESLSSVIINRNVGLVIKFLFFGQIFFKIFICRKKIKSEQV